MNSTEKNEPLWEEIVHSGVVGGHKVLFYDSVDSTNAMAMSLGLDDSVAVGTVILSKTQTKGRGRLGKTWMSPPGTGLYFSMILRPALVREDLAKITLGVGLAVANAVEAAVGAGVMIKWPNDVLLDGKKVAGVLTESGSWSGSDRPLVVVGVGINVNTPITAFDAGIQGLASSLLESTGQLYDKGELLKLIIAGIDVEVARLENDGFAELLAEWCNKDATYLQRLTWVTAGGQTVTGVSLGPDSDGLLRVKDDRGKLHEVMSGDLTLT